MQNYHAQQSWDEMGEFDLPAMINKVLETTREEQLVYIGHSMGATGFLAMAAFRPQMQSKINAKIGEKHWLTAFCFAI